MPALLAIETSQRVGGVALRDDRGVVLVEMLAPKKRHDDDLLPAIDRVFKRATLSPSDLAGGAVGVSIGPGGFTGLRIAVTTAKMFAEALGANVIAVPSALVAAHSTFATPSAPATDAAALGQPVPLREEVIICLACKDFSCWCTRVRRDLGGWR